MSQKSSLTQSDHSVRQALTAYNSRRLGFANGQRTQLLSEWAFVTKTEPLYPPIYTEVQVSLLSRTIERDGALILVSLC